MTYKVLVRKDSMNTVAVDKATYDDVVAYCAGRGDIEGVLDEEGNAVAPPEVDEEDHTDADTGIVSRVRRAVKRK